MSLAHMAFAMMAFSMGDAPATDLAPLSRLEKTVCKRIYDVGSFIKYKDVCLTNREWERVADRARRDAATIAGR